MPGAPLKLRCEFASNPLGVTRRKPRLSWWVNDPRPAELQTAYEVMAASTQLLLDEGDVDLWFSGRIESDQCNLVEYQGPELASQQTVWWKVRTFDSDGISGPWSEPAFFHMGLLDATDWRADWIAAPLRGSLSRGVHAVALRREFALERVETPAFLYVCVLGDYRLEINGRALPDVELNAIWSDFDRAAYYQVIDVTALLQPGLNCIGILLSDGYYSGELAGAGRCNYGDRPVLRVQLESADPAHVVGSDAQWRWRPSWILAAGINEGEHVDARQQVPGWSRAGLDESLWSPVEVLPAQAVELRAQMHDRYVARQLLRPLAMPATLRRAGRSYCVLDFGDDLVGRVRMELRSTHSDHIKLYYALDAEFENATHDTYTSAGQGEDEVFIGQFAMHTFRYVQVEFTTDVTNIAEVLAMRVAARSAPGISFRCDHPGLNKLVDALSNSLAAVAMSVPMRGVDMLQRLPDAGYASTWVPLYAEQINTRALVGKWVADIQDAYDGGSDAAAVVPVIDRLHGEDVGDEFARFEAYARTLWALYRSQNDVDALHAGYARLRVAALSYRHRYEDLLRKSSLKDLYGASHWRSLVATCTLYGALRTTAQIAGVLAHVGDLELIETLAGDVRKAFRRRFVTRDGHLLGDCQSAYVASLYHNLLEGRERELAEQRLAHLLQGSNYHTDVAPAVMRGLLPVLTRADRLDLAYMVLLQTSAPSWLAVTHEGSNLIGYEPGVFDIAQVGLLEWLLESLVGISLHEDYSVGRNGYRSVRVRPKPPFGTQFDAGAPVQFVEASLPTVHGVYLVTWQIQEDGFELELVVPPGCTALVTMPDEIEQQVSSGHHRFVMDFDAGGDGIPTLLDLAGGADAGH